MIFYVPPVDLNELYNDYPKYVIEYKAYCDNQVWPPVFCEKPELKHSINFGTTSSGINIQ